MNEEDNKKIIHYCTYCDYKTNKLEENKKHTETDTEKHKINILFRQELLLLYQQIKH